MVTKKDKAADEELNAEDYPEGKPLPPDKDPSFHVEEWPAAYHEGFDDEGKPVAKDEPTPTPQPAPAPKDS
jgi:hypothetical protein